MNLKQPNQTWEITHIYLHDNGEGVVDHTAQGHIISLSRYPQT